MSTTASKNAAVAPGARRGALVSAASLRVWHASLSAFIAPTVVFFALTGALQTLGLHEAHGGYVPSAAISALARLHKQQVLAPEPPRPPRPSSDGRPRAAGAGGLSPAAEVGDGAARPGSGGTPRRSGIEAPPSVPTVLLKALFVSTALALALTTVLGMWIGLTHAKRKAPFLRLLGAGALVPAVLLIAQRLAPM